MRKISALGAVLLWIAPQSGAIAQQLTLEEIKTRTGKETCPRPSEVISGDFKFTDICPNYQQLVGQAKIDCQTETTRQNGILSDYNKYIRNNCTPKNRSAGKLPIYNIKPIQMGASQTGAAPVAPKQVLPIEEPTKDFGPSKSKEDCEQQGYDPNGLKKMECEAKKNLEEFKRYKPRQTRAPSRPRAPAAAHAGKSSDSFVDGLMARTGNSNSGGGGSSYGGGVFIPAMPLGSAPTFGPRRASNAVRSAPVQQAPSNNGRAYTNCPGPYACTTR